MDMRLICAFLLLALLQQCSAESLSTTPDGSIQAIAQGPDSISLYWRHEGRSAKVFVNGQPRGSLEPNPAGPYSSKTIGSLLPNTFYTFAVGESSPTVTERTWAKLPAQESFDLLVIGGTASGWAAAVVGARMGMKVALVESTNRLGGMTSNGLGAVDMRNMAHSNGAFQDFRERVIEFYGGGEGRKLEPRVANAILKSMAYEQSCLSLFMKVQVTGAIREANCVRGAIVCDTISGAKGRLYAKVTIDATDCADFAATAGVEYRVGREPRTDCEPHAGYIYFDDAAQTILPGSTGCADAKVQSYAYLMTWKDYGDRPAPLVERPASYSPEDYTYSPEWAKTWNATSGVLPNSKFEINQHPFGIDKPGINFDYPCADAKRRCEIDAIYRERALGYLYFMQNERGHKNLGLADDEYLDSNNFPPGLYVREARRVIGEHLVTECEVTNARQYFHADSVGIAEYPMDSHAMEELRAPDDRLDKGEGEMYLSAFTPWSQVPYGVIVPRCVEGLLVTTAVSATHVAYGTLRLEAVRMSMGQAAAVAARLAITRGVSLRCVNPAWIQDSILSQHAYIYWFSDVTPMTRHFKAISFLGARGVLVSEPFRPDSALTEQEALAAVDRLVRLEGGMPQQIELQASQAEMPVTRGLFAKWLVQSKARVDATWRAAVARQSYEDVAPGSPYFEAVEALRAHRITPSLFANYKPGLFQPEAPMTRADAAQAIYLAHRAYAMSH